jgi:hypothetical protein
MTVGKHYSVGSLAAIRFRGPEQQSPKSECPSKDSYAARSAAVAFGKA